MVIMVTETVNKVANLERALTFKWCSDTLTEGLSSKCQSLNLLPWLIYLIDLVVDNLLLVTKRTNILSLYTVMLISGYPVNRNNGF